MPRAEKQKGGLRFDVKSEAFRKGDSGERSIVPGKAAESELLRRVTSTDQAPRTLVNFSTETKETRAMYGIDNPTTRSFGSKCLMARRLIKKGVRFVQV